MNTNKFQQRLKQFYQETGYAEVDGFVFLGLLTEDTGKVARIMRELEFGPHPLKTQITSDKINKKLLSESIGNLLGNLTLIAIHYDIELQDICEEHIEKLEKLHSMMHN